MKKLLALLLLLFPLPTLAQIGPVGALTVGTTSVLNGTNGDCLTISNGKLGQTASCGGASGLTVGTSTITGGTTTRILYDNAGVLGEYTLSGSGTVVAMASSPVFTTPSLGVASATSVTTAAGAANGPGVGIGANGSGLYERTSGVLDVTLAGTARAEFNSASLRLGSTGLFLWSSGAVTASGDTGLSRITAAIVGVGNGTATDVSGTLRAAALSAGGSDFTVTAVNAVSPTSPNRTVTISYNGTTYYLAAKTTND